MGSELYNSADETEQDGGVSKGGDSPKQNPETVKAAHPIVSSSEVLQGTNEDDKDLEIIRTESFGSGLTTMDRHVTPVLLSRKPPGMQTDASELTSQSKLSNLNTAAHGQNASLDHRSSLSKAKEPCVERNALQTIHTISLGVSEEVRQFPPLPPSTKKPYVIWIDGGRELQQNGTECAKSDLDGTEKTSCPPAQSLPPTDPHTMDTGWAWMVLFGCTLLHMLTDGVISSLGIFLVIWQEQFPDCKTSEISVILSLIFGCAYVAGPLGSALCKTFSIRQVVMGGTILTSISFVMAAFSTRLWHLYVTFTMAGLGLALAIQPTTVIITYYFDKLLARANGVSYAGVGLGIFALPPLFQMWINDYGWQGALLIIGGLMSNIGICAALYRSTPLEIKSRKPRRKSIQIKDESTNVCIDIKDSKLYSFVLNILKSFDVKLLKNFQFDLLLIGNLLYGIAYAIAIVYLPARAVQAGIHPLQAAFLVSVIGISSFISRITHGHVIDHQIMTAPVLTASAFFVCGIACALNPVTDDYAGLIALSALVGLTSGVYNSTVPLMAKDYVGLHKVSGGVGLLHLVTGSGVTLGSYSAGFLVDATGGYDMPFYLAGACFIVCSLLVFAFPLSKCWKQRDSDEEDTVIEAKHKEDVCGQDNVAMEIE